MLKGDASDTFSFVEFFPEAVHPVLAPVCDGVYGALVQLRVCAPFSDEAVEVGNQNVGSRSEGLPSILNNRGGGGAGGGRRAEAERRRALALKALDQRLSAAAANRTASAAVQTAAPTISGDAPGITAGAPTGEGASQVKEAQA